MNITFKEIGSQGELNIDGKIIKMHGTYSPGTYYFDFGELPESIKNQMHESIEIDDSRYTVHVPTAFLRVDFETVEGESIQFELHLGTVEFDDDFNNEGESILTDPDATYMDRAGEFLACSDSLDFQSVYIRID